MQPVPVPGNSDDLAHSIPYDAVNAAAEVIAERYGYHQVRYGALAGDIVARVGPLLRRDDREWVATQLRSAFGGHTGSCGFDCYLIAEFRTYLLGAGPLERIVLDAYRRYGIAMGARERCPLATAFDAVRPDPDPAGGQPGAGPQ